jgi:uncharacterized membrane protein YdjX (TVP38/TMEM64 family)
MKRLRAFLPLLILVAIGIALIASGALERFRPEHLGAEQLRLRAGYHAFPFSYTMFLRLVPFFPFGGVTVALAWLRCPLWLFLTATAIGGTVMIAFETALGAGLAETIAREGQVSFDMFSHPHVLLPMLGMAVLALVPIVLGQLRRLSRKPQIGNRESRIDE